MSDAEKAKNLENTNKNVGKINKTKSPQRRLLPSCGDFLKVFQGSCDVTLDLRSQVLC